MDSPITPSELTYLGETIGFWIQTAVVLLGAGAAVFTIYKNGVLNRQSNEHNEKIARQRATIDLIMSQRADLSLSESKQAVSQIHNCGGEFVALAATSQEGEQNRKHLLAILNNYEFIALGIREGALDDSIYKRAVYSQVLRDWKAMQPFILELRRQKSIPTLFQEFEHLAKKWTQNQLKADGQ